MVNNEEEKQIGSGRRIKRRRRVRVGQKSVGQISHELSAFNRADNLPLVVAVFRRVINELADARPLVVFGDKKIFVRHLARTFDRAG